MSFQPNIHGMTSLCVNHEELLSPQPLQVSVDVRVAPRKRPAMSSLSKHQRLYLGMVVLLLVDVIWVASSELTEVLFKTEGYSKPFFSTYFKTSMFLIYLSGFCFWKPWRDLCRRNVTYTYVDPNIEEPGSLGESESLLGEPVFVPIRTPDTAPGDKSSGTESDDPSAALSNARNVRFSKLAEVRQLSESQAEDSVLARLSYSASLRAQDAAERLANKLPVRQVTHIALLFCLLWFIASYSYQLALVDTEAAVVNVLSSCSGIFTLTLTAIFPANSGDKFSLSKLLAVLLSITGVVLVSLSDMKGDSIPIGAIWATQSALFYALYIVFLRRKVETEDKMDIPMFFGFVGLFNLIILWPGIVILHFTGLESFQWPTVRQWVFLVVNGMVGTVFSEFLWLWGCFLTSSLIGTIALSLNIPLTLMADMLVRKKQYTLLFFIGTVPTALAFLAVNLLAHYENWDPVMDALRHVFQFVCHRRRIVRVRDGDREQTESLIGINTANDEHDA